MKSDNSSSGSSGSSSSSSSSSDGENNKIYFHFSKCIVNGSAYKYNSKVLNVLDIDSVVRISYVVDYSPVPSWTHDSPFVKIIEIDIENSEYLGIVLDINRIKNTNKYLLNIGEKVWFNKDNIIEIETNEATQPFLTKEKVMCTGPLFTVESESDSDSDSDSEYYASDSD